TPPGTQTADSNPIISGVGSNTRSVIPDVSTSAIGRGRGAAGAPLSSSRENVGTDPVPLAGLAPFACCASLRLPNSRARSTRVARTTALAPYLSTARRARARSSSGIGSRACFFPLRHAVNADSSSTSESIFIVEFSLGDHRRQQNSTTKAAPSRSHLPEQ